ncbi:heavy metal translocating P-type ATPase [Tsukamurella tyrosinosolvens]|uniref:heavy metal translocating P-type ATPase n=1 Tax=Tsukamurella tyrosinosolvens TaxID=57704 RepID=UPI000C7F1C70|nr:cation-translocating P-type ATPase [Tsukamurella tyrosinosolvens]AUN40065.1 copper-translocating P-type ATPase [Tsukamurella tyrosinosolvens]
MTALSEPAGRVVSQAAGRLRWVLDDLIGATTQRRIAVEDAVLAIAGVRAAHAYSNTGSLVVWHRSDVDPARIAEAAAEGLAADTSLVARHAPHSADVTNADLLRMGLGAAALVLLGLRRYAFRRPPLLGPGTRTAATAITVFTGYPFLRGALRSLRGGRAGTDALVSAATIASLLLRENVVALTVLWLLNIGEFLQDLTLRRTRRAISDLLRGNTDSAWLRLADGAEVQVPIDALDVGDVVIVHDHVAVPVDGVVVDGLAVVDQAALTGETLPVTIEPGATVHAGAVVVSGRLVVRATAVGADTAIGRIIERVEEAERDRAPIQTVGDNFSRRFVPGSFLLSGLTLLLTRDLRRAMTMLLIACPCAVGLSTPTAISGAIGNGARRGILIKGGSHLEAAGSVTAVVFDKTGTLTTGRPVVTNVVSFRDDWTPEQVLAHAASSEIHSRHPLAEAVIRSTEERHIEIPSHAECEVIVGLGMRTQAEDGRVLLLGSPALLEQHGVAVGVDAARWVERLRAECETPLLLAVDGALTGLVSLRDEVRTEAAETLAAVAAAGIGTVVMLTGDHPATAAAIAAELGITRWRAEVMPEDKLAEVRALQDEGHVVAMVGDGVNDAPALAAADVGIAMGLAGTDVAVETADVALAGDDLRNVLDVVDLGRRAVDVIRQNYGMSIAVNSVGLLVGAGGALSPVLAAILHNASSVAVVLNSSRLIRYRLAESAGHSSGARTAALREGGADEGR